MSSICYFIFFSNALKQFISLENIQILKNLVQDLENLDLKFLFDSTSGFADMKDFSVNFVSMHRKNGNNLIYSTVITGHIRKNAKHRCKKSFQICLLSFMDRLMLRKNLKVRWRLYFIRKKYDLFSSAEAGEPEQKKKSKRGGKGLPKAPKKSTGVEQKISLSRAPRGKNKFVTVITGLSTCGKENRVQSMQNLNTNCILLMKTIWKQSFDVIEILMKKNMKKKQKNNVKRSEVCKVLE